MSSVTSVKRIRPQLNFTGLLASDVAARALAVVFALIGNVAFPKPPVDLEAFKTLVMDFIAAISAATLDGGKNAIATRDKLRLEVSDKLRDIGHYVESCNPDLPTFLTSGFLPVSGRSKIAADNLPQPSAVRLDQGVSGELLVTVQSIEKARQYELRCAEIGPEGPQAWQHFHFATTKDFSSVQNLTPGKTYAFQVRVFGKNGYSDWSDSVSRMCI
jgi:hypothetical protein